MNNIIFNKINVATCMHVHYYHKTSYMCVYVFCVFYDIRKSIQIIVNSNYMYMYLIVVGIVV